MPYATSSQKTLKRAIFLENTAKLAGIPRDNFLNIIHYLAGLAPGSFPTKASFSS